MQHRTVQWSTAMLLLLTLISNWPHTSNCQSSPSSPITANISNTSNDTSLNAVDQSMNGTAGSSSNQTASSSPNPSPLPSPNPSLSPSPDRDANGSLVSATNQSAASPNPDSEFNNSSIVDNPKSSSSSSGRLSNWDLSRQIVKDIGAIKANVFNFWQKYGPDNEFGGFQATLDRYGAPINPTYKGIVQQTRHIWAFSTFHQQGYTTSSSPSAQDMAKSTYDFVAKNMRDPTDGLWYNTVTREGNPWDVRKFVMQQLFVLYAFSQYSQVFGSTEARDLALDTFRTLDAAWHNADTGGYNEGGSRRSLNSLMHGTEAFIALHKATGDAIVLARLLEVLEILATRVTLTKGLIHEHYQPASGKAQWTPESELLNYGHNLEVAWLMIETLNYLGGIPGALDSATEAQYRRFALDVGAAAVRDGYDMQYGGVFESNSSKAKLWWVQNEALLGLYVLGDAAAFSTVDGRVDYLQLLADTARFIRDKQTDTTGPGEQFWQVNTDGTWQVTGDPQKDAKGSVWKASYHSSRAPLFLEKWLN